MPQLIPLPDAPVLEGQRDSRFTLPWSRFFQGLIGGGQEPAVVTVGASPFELEIDFNGTAVVRGGTVSLIEIIRSDIAVNMGVTAGPIPVSVGDTLRITYTVAPNVTIL